MTVDWSGVRTRRVVGVVAVAALGVAGSVPAAAADAARRHDGYRQVNLVSDVRGLARLHDPLVKNPWGISFGASTPLWVANNGTNAVTIYAGANGHDPISRVPLVVKSRGGPTGTVYNDGVNIQIPGRHGKHGPAIFLFDSLGGHLQGWTPAAPPLTRAHTRRTPAGAAFTGLALSKGHGGRLYAADEATGRVRMFDRHFEPVGSFRDPTLPASYGPYNVAVMGGKLYVTFVPPDGSGLEPAGVVDVYSLDGTNRHRLVTGGPLEGPWGMVIAPPHWGRFGGDLLVGNEDGGRINAFDRRTGRFHGALRTPSGRAIENEGLWGLAFGNGVIGTPRTLIFAAGIDEYAHGLVGLITPAK